MIPDDVRIYLNEGAVVKGYDLKVTGEWALLYEGEPSNYRVRPFRWEDIGSVTVVKGRQEESKGMEVG